jgi:hypothetical protein
VEVTDTKHFDLFVMAKVMSLADTSLPQSVLFRNCSVNGNVKLMGVGSIVQICSAIEWIYDSEPIILCTKYMLLN